MANMIELSSNVLWLLFACAIVGVLAWACKTNTVSKFEAEDRSLGCGAACQSQESEEFKNSKEEEKKLAKWFDESGGPVRVANKGEKMGPIGSQRYSLDSVARPTKYNSDQLGGLNRMLGLTARSKLALAAAENQNPAARSQAYGQLRSATHKLISGADQLGLNVLYTQKPKNASLDLRYTPPNPAGPGPLRGLSSQSDIVGLNSVGLVEALAQ